MRVGNKGAGQLPGYAKMYLIATKHTGDYLTRVLPSSSFLSEHHAKVSVMLGMCLWIICFMLSGMSFQKFLTDLKLEDYKQHYNHNDIPLPKTAFQNMSFECPDRRAHVVVAGDHTVILTDALIENKSNSPIYINLSGSKPLRIRARLWNAQLGRHVQDGIPQSYKRKVLVPPQTVFDTVLAISGKGVNPALVGDDTFLDFGIVQEGVSWTKAETNCRFKVVKFEEGS